MGPVGHGDPPDRAEVGQELGHVERRGDRLAPARLAHEREVEHRQVAGLDQAGQLAQPFEPVAAPAGAVDDEPVGVLEQVVRLLGPERRLARPPDGDRQVVDEERLDDRGDVPAGVAAGGHVDRLGAGLGRALAREHALGGDPGVEPARTVRIGRRADQGPRGMAAGELRDDRRAALAELGPPGDDDQVHHARPGGDVASLHAVDGRWSARGRPRSWPARARSRRSSSRATSSAGSAPPAAAARLRSVAIAVRRGPSARRPRPVPTSPPRSSGSRGPACRPRRR